jgi:hypothetical protein
MVSEKMIPVYIALLIIALAGCLGGFINSLLININLVKATNNLSIADRQLRLNYLVNTIAGAVAAAISWGLYGPLANAGIFSKTDTNSLSLSALLGAVSVGFSGSSWLTTHADKREWQKNTQEALKVDPQKVTPTEVAKIASLGPVEAERLIKEIQTQP